MATQLVNFLYINYSQTRLLGEKKLAIIHVYMYMGNYLTCSKNNHGVDRSVFVAVNVLIIIIGCPELRNVAECEHG